MKTFRTILRYMFLAFTLTLYLSTAVHAETYRLALNAAVHAETYRFTLDTSYLNNYEYATLTAVNEAGQVVWTYYSDYYPAAELSHFQMILNNEYVYLVENGSIKLFDFYTGRVKWTNSDFGGSPANGCYVFSSSGKLYISGYYGPDLFVVDTDGTTICRVNELCPGSYWIDSMWWSGEDEMCVHYSSDQTLFTFNVLDYFGRRDGLY